MVDLVAPNPISVAFPIFPFRERRGATRAVFSPIRTKCALCRHQ